MDLLTLGPDHRCPRHSLLSSVYYSATSVLTNTGDFLQQQVASDHAQPILRITYQPLLFCPTEAPPGYIKLQRSTFLSGLIHHYSCLGGNRPTTRGGSRLWINTGFVTLETTVKPTNTGSRARTFLQEQIPWPDPPTPGLGLSQANPLPMGKFGGWYPHPMNMHEILLSACSVVFISKKKIITTKYMCLNYQCDESELEKISRTTYNS